VFEINAVSKVASKCRNLVGHFKHSTTNTSEMRKRQKLVNVTSHELVQDVSIRWNSTQLMLERLVEQRRVLTDVIFDEKFTKKAEVMLLPKDHEWEIMSDISTVLKDLSEVTTYICVEKHVSLSQVYPIVCGLIKKSLKLHDNDSSVVRKVKETISGELKRRYRPFDNETANNIPVMASLLDPRYKRLTFASVEQCKMAEDCLESKLALKKVNK